MTNTERAGRRAKRTAVPDDVRSRTALRRVDYQDAFIVHTGAAGRGSAEDWIRGVFESAPAPLRSSLRLGWRVVGARLGPFPSRAHVVGWRIGENTADGIRLDVDWRIGLRANLVLRTRPSSVTLATFVEHGGRASRIVWSALLPVHVRTLRYLLTRAARVHDSGRPRRPRL
ncbi:hypothetical protein SAMN05421810_101852 [Amycolatopsis arida]|uniref:DUF2867 domain-containing protein n=1 Tax=Amycolatopsis arida TaxID=587909 RepID=A0A1I5MAV3_9PSEU|nr:hypothetical protein [Amycolatopsis arida]TDX94026.1 hypothetical protein CLV69_104484 [Amycolatopsis arida]SFP06477.1 hypothetical protein SAMN05421810_101852 [Amycolatopsis arida]